MLIYIYSDESGDFNFSSQPSASRYFILMTIAQPTTPWSLMTIGGFAGVCLIFYRGTPYHVDATILEKRKAEPNIRYTPASFYGFAWYYHLMALVPKLVKDSDGLLVVAASAGTNEMRSEFYSAVSTINSRISPVATVRATMCWQRPTRCCRLRTTAPGHYKRKWERSDTTSYDLINDKVASEFDVFRESTTACY